MYGAGDVQTLARQQLPLAASSHRWCLTLQHPGLNAALLGTDDGIVRLFEPTGVP
jgi:hypothetical protein